MYQDQVPTGHGTEANQFWINCVYPKVYEALFFQKKKKKSSYNGKQLETAAKQHTFTA